MVFLDFSGLAAAAVARRVSLCNWKWAARLISGIGIDGYVSGATVWWDANSDGILNSGEVYSTTNNDGTFELDGVGSTGQIVIDGGVDIETGAEVDTMVISLSDVTDTTEVTVTPLTLLSHMVLMQQQFCLR